MTRKQKALAWLAENFVGVTETKNNGGAMVERFQRTVDGVAAGEPWCVGFVQFCVREIDSLFYNVFSDLDSKPNELPVTEWTIGLWGMAHADIRRTEPDVGCIVVWQSLADPSKGHCGIVTELRFSNESAELIVVTVEGNTGALDQRDGDGVWQKIRHSGNIPGFKRLGYIAPWA